MHKGWLLIVLSYFVIFTIGSVVYVLKDKKSIETPKKCEEVATNWKPAPLPGNAIAIIALDDSSIALAEHLQEGHKVRLCVGPMEKRSRPPGGWCGPIMTVAGLSDDLDDSPWLALYVSTDETLVDSTAYIVAENQVLLYVNAGDEESSRRDEAGEGCQRDEKGKGDNSAGTGAQPDDDEKGGGDSSTVNDRAEVIVVEMVDGYIDVAGIFLQLLQYAGESGIYIATGTTESLKDLAFNAAVEFINAFAETVGEEAAKELFGREPRRVAGKKRSGLEELPDQFRRPIVAAANVYFNVDDTSVPNFPNAVALIADINSLGKEWSACTVTVFGHADTSGPDAYNRRLSENRAKSVAVLLDAFPADSLRLRACGEKSPRLRTDDEVLERENRRVDVIASCTNGNSSARPAKSGFGQTKESLCEEIKE